MIDWKQKILDATNGGLDVIYYYYPQARDVVEGRAKHFKMRDEKTPSATLKEYDGVWLVTDFGDDATPRNCIDIAMRQENLNFSQACHRLAELFNVDCSYSKTINAPVIKERNPHENEDVGSITWVVKDKPTEADIAALGKCVTADVMKKYNVYALEHYDVTRVNDKNRVKTMVIHSNENYPIFLFDFGEFQKIVCPYAYEKKNRFRYVGKKEKDVIYGMKQVVEAYNKLKAEYEDEEDEKKKKRKLPEVILCSGERDALNCAGMGYPVIWLNSETAQFGSKEMNRLRLYTDKVINIPDLDTTGVRQAYVRALENWEMYTLLLPDWLPTYKDRRGKPRKDLQDWCELNGNRFEFDKMLKTAKRCQFWDTYNKKEETKYEINTINLLWYLRCSGFYQIEDNISGQNILVRLDGFVAKQYNAKQIRAYIKSEMERLHVSNTIQKLFQDSKKTSSSLMEDLKTVDLNFEKSTPDSRVFFFQNTALRVTANNIEAIDKSNLSGNYTWDTNISPHNFKRIEPAISLIEGNYFAVNHTYSAYARVLINASRMYWRRELEERATGDYAIDEAYKQANHFNLTGERLTQEEQDEQQRHFMNKCYAIGYMLHQYKFKHNAKAVWVMENRLTEDGESAGGSGKSFFVETIKQMHLLNVVTLQGRDRSLTDNKHLLDRINKHTDILFVDDPAQHFDFDFFYTMITGNTTINPKGEKSFEIDYKDSPIPVFASNFPPQHGRDKSTIRRLQMVVFSDYYHEKGDTDLYRETRTIYDDLGIEVGGNAYTEDQYNADLNFLIDCVQFYLQCRSQNISIQPPMDNVWKRISISEMGNSGFRDWAETYFAADGENVDICLPRDMVMNDFANSTGTKNWTSQRFNKALKGFCDYMDYVAELNPRELYSKSSPRIIRKVNNVTKECIYIRTKDVETGILKPIDNRTKNQYGQIV